MWYNVGMANISISKSKITKESGVVVLPVKEYKRLLEAAAIPDVYLTGKAAEDLDKLVEEGLREYRAGKTRTLRSLAELNNPAVRRRLNL